MANHAFSSGGMHGRYCLVCGNLRDHPIHRVVHDSVLRGIGALNAGSLARNTDPDTSHTAIPRDVTRQCIIVLRAYTDGKDYLDEEAYQRVGLIGHQRCTDLRRAGYIERNGRKLTPFGKPAYLCRITPNGSDFLRLFEEMSIEDLMRGLKSWRGDKNNSK